jgi:hypothetical protein
MQHGNGMKASVCVRSLREGCCMSGVGVTAHNTVTMSALFLLTSNQPSRDSLRPPADQSQQSDSNQNNKTAIELGSAAISATADDKFLQKGLPTLRSFAKQELRKLGPLVTLNTVKLGCLLIHYTPRSLEHIDLGTAWCVRHESNNSTPHETRLAL